MLTLTALVAASALALEVPYLPQTDDLCGGAAAAMVLRYWGDAHAVARDFAPLVDRRVHGITGAALIHAIEQRGWRAEHLRGSLDALRAEIVEGHPVIVLIEDRGDRYHYVVVLGADGDEVVLHDPAWGPSRRLETREFVRRWQASGFWSIVILPATVRAEQTVQTVQTVRLKPDPTYRVTVAAAETAADLAGIRFTEHRWRDAARLARQALALDAHDDYAWDVLASSRFMQDEAAGALEAWNRIGRPRLDAVRIEGLTRTRYALVAEALALTPGSLLSVDSFRRAERRLQELPDQTSVRLAYRPLADGFAGVDAAIVERSARPRGTIEWAARGAQTAVDREVTASLPAGMGQGEVWDASWRWWSDRPRVALSFAAPRVGVVPGVWRVEGSWEAQTYATAASGGAVRLVREERTRGALTVSDWLTGSVRYEITGGIDAWNGGRRSASVGGAVERRWLSDRASLEAGATMWLPLTDDPGFRAAHVCAGFASSTVADGTVMLSDAGFDFASAAAPFALWSGAGDGHARAPLLRGHALLTGGVVTGPVFGRRLTYANTEIRRWIDTRQPVRFAIAAFVDGAGVPNRTFQTDVGVGVRVKAPGQKGVLRVDFARGLRDGSHALTFGWQY